MIVKAYMTNGTLHFLIKLVEKHTNIHFLFMNNPTSTLAYYEGEEKSVFAAGREYHVVIKSGKMIEGGYVAMNNIPVTTEGAPILEHQFQKRRTAIEAMPGFRAFRLLRPKKGHTYIALTQWSSELYIENWMDSEEFSEVHRGQGVKQPAYFPERPFLTRYRVLEADELPN